MPVHICVCIVSIKVRSTVIAGLSQMCCSSPQSIRQALGGILQAIGFTSELSLDALVKIITAIEFVLVVTCTSFVVPVAS